MTICAEHNVGDLAQLLVAARFLEAGRLPAWPLTVRAYDLLVDGGDAIYRVQVKKGRKLDTGPDNWACVLTKHKPVPATAFDYLVVWCDFDRSYVIPAAALRNVADPAHLIARVQIAAAGTRFAAYLNRFTLGSGEPRPVAPMAALEKGFRRFWYERPDKQAGVRKRHRRLTTAEVKELRRLPIRYYKHQPHAEGLIPIEQVAQQFDVSVLTIRNLLQGKRKDLQDTAETA